MNIFDRLYKYLIPKYQSCIYCKKNNSKDNRKFGLCDQCYQEIEWIQNIKCTICGRASHCNDCIKREETFFVMNRSAVKYNDAMRGFLINYKFRGDERMRKLLGHMLIHAYLLLIKSNPQLLNTKKTLITYVPISEERLVERGFNQTEYLAYELGNYSGVKVAPLLKRKIHKTKQSSKTRFHRLLDIQNAFEISQDFLYLNDNRLGEKKNEIEVIYVVDDVYTTGSTLNECAKTLKEKLGKKVYGLSWARA